MKMAMTVLAGCLALFWTVDAVSAKSKSRSYASKYQSDNRAYRRSNTVASNGLCQRDTGTHNSNLSFRNKCDVEEFWARQNGRGRR